MATLNLIFEIYLLLYMACCYCKKYIFFQILYKVCPTKNATLYHPISILLLLLKKIKCWKFVSILLNCYFHCSPSFSGAVLHAWCTTEDAPPRPKLNQIQNKKISKLKNKKIVYSGQNTTYTKKINNIIFYQYYFSQKFYTKQNIRWEFWNLIIKDCTFIIVKFLFKQQSIN